MKKSIVTSSRFIRSHTFQKQILLSLILAIIITPSAMSAGVYKWIDKEGEVHYGSKRPADTAAELVNIPDSRTPYTQDGKKTEKPIKKIKIEDIDDALPMTTEPPKISAKERARVCKDARNSLQNILSHGRIREFDKKGESVILGEKERQKRIKEENEFIRKNCQ